jgi:hypothetical protein
MAIEKMRSGRCTARGAEAGRQAGVARHSMKVPSLLALSSHNQLHPKLSALL